MKIEEHNTLINKAKTRKDGVYSYNTYLYVVKNNAFIAYSDYFGNISSIQGVFHYQIGKVESYDRKKKLIEYLRNLK